MAFEPELDLIGELHKPQSLWARFTASLSNYWFLLLLKFRVPDKYAKFAGIEYIGRAGSSQDCQDAVCRLLQYGHRIVHVKILTSDNNHCLLLADEIGDLFAVKCGFASGYGGQGPNAFSYVLKLLEAHNAEINEYIVDSELLRKIDASCLMRVDLDDLDKAQVNYPNRLYDYILRHHWDIEKDGTLWNKFPVMPPFALIDGRIIDLAKSFWDGPDDKLLVGYRRLEDVVRNRTGLADHGPKLFARAFAQDDGPLVWPGTNGGEHTGRMQLFSGAYMAYRNHRAHRESDADATGSLAEFLLLNHLYLLEKQAACRGKPSPSEADQER